jgi:hypothetical protein
LSCWKDCNFQSELDQPVWFCCYTYADRGEIISTTFLTLAIVILTRDSIGASIDTQCRHWWRISKPVPCRSKSVNGPIWSLASKLLWESATMYFRCLPHWLVSTVGVYGGKELSMRAAFLFQRLSFPHPSCHCFPATLSALTHPVHSAPAAVCSQREVELNLMGFPFYLTANTRGRGQDQARFLLGFPSSYSPCLKSDCESASVILFRTYRPALYGQSSQSSASSRNAMRSLKVKHVL